MEEYVQSEKGQSEIAEYKDVFNYIGNNSGLNITKFQDLYNLYFGVSTEVGIFIKKIFLQHFFRKNGVLYCRNGRKKFGQKQLQNWL